MPASPSEQQACPHPQSQEQISHRQHLKRRRKEKKKKKICEENQHQKRNRKCNTYEPSRHRVRSGHRTQSQTCRADEWSQLRSKCQEEAAAAALLQGVVPMALTEGLLEMQTTPHPGVTRTEPQFPKIHRWCVYPLTSLEHWAGAPGIWNLDGWKKEKRKIGGLHNRRRFSWTELNRWLLVSQLHGWGGLSVAAELSAKADIRRKWRNIFPLESCT